MILERVKTYLGYVNSIYLEEIKSLKEFDTGSSDGVKTTIQRMNSIVVKGYRNSLLSYQDIIDEIIDDIYFNKDNIDKLCYDIKWCGLEIFPTQLDKVKVLIDLEKNKLDLTNNLSEYSIVNSNPNYDTFFDPHDIFHDSQIISFIWLINLLEQKEYNYEILYKSINTFYDNYDLLQNSYEINLASFEFIQSIKLKEDTDKELLNALLKKHKDDYEWIESEYRKKINKTSTNLFWV